MFILFGNSWRTKRKSRGIEIEKTCPACQTRGSFHEIEARNYFTLFFIPLFPAESAGSALECGSCGHQLPITNQDYIEVLGDLPDHIKEARARGPRTSVHCPSCLLQNSVPPDGVHELPCQHCKRPFTVVNGQPRL